MFNDSIILKGELIISLDNKPVKRVRNLIVTTGKAWVASRMQGVADGVMTHMAIGTSTTAALVSDTTMGNEAARVAIDVSGGVVVGRIITLTATIPADVPNITDPDTTPVTEAGLFDSASAGIMLAHTVFPVINKGEFQTMSISWAITIN
jgi:hypothetical protein